MASLLDLCRVLVEKVSSFIYLSLGRLGIQYVFILVMLGHRIFSLLLCVLTGLGAFVCLFCISVFVEWLIAV